METYVIRIVLHGADAEDYEKLHEAMSRRGAFRTVVSDGITFQMPEAEYVRESGHATKVILDETMAIADFVYPNNSVFVTQVKDWAWYLPKKD